MADAATADAVPNRRAVAEREELLTRIATEYREMAGLSLTLPQACRLFHLDPDRCKRIFRELLEHGVLRMGDDGQIMRSENDFR